MTTIRDVAQAAGVSPATVSRVLNGKVGVDAELALRVREAATSLRYRPSGVARSLRTKATRVWGMIIPDIENPFFTSIVRAAQDTAWDVGYSVVVCNTDEDLEREARLIEVLVAERAAGILIAPASEEETDLGPIVEREIPVVLVDRPLAGAELDVVMVDNLSGAREAVAHLVAAGRRRIGCVWGPEATTAGRQRLEGFRLALADAGIAPDETLIVPGGHREEGGYEAARRLLAAPDPPAAIFACNNWMTSGAVRAIAERGLRVGEDVALAGFDELPWSPIAGPRVTQVKQPTYEIGRRAADLLARRIAGDDSGPKRVVLAPTLIPGSGP